MRVDRKAALEQIAAALKVFEEYCKKYFDQGKLKPNLRGHSLGTDESEMRTRIRATIARLAPPGSLYQSLPDGSKEQLAGFLKALRADYEAGHLDTVRELIHGETLPDFLDVALQLLGEEKDATTAAAAVIAGGVLEQHLRALCIKYGVATNYYDKGGQPQPKMINAMNTELYKPAGAYAQSFMQQITGWAVVRNHAAHGEYAKVDAKNVELMIAGLRHFMNTHPA